MPQNQAAPTTNGDQAKRILLVDDEPGIRRAYSRLLTANGYVVETAPDGREAVQQLERGNYDVILSDISMPGMNGLDFLRTVREHDLDVPVILITGGPAVDTAIKAMEYGVFQYLIKPVEPNALDEVLSRAIRFHALAKLKRQALELLGNEGKWLGDRAALETRFSRALETLWPAFHPIVSWRERKVFGYEALLRTGEQSLARPPDFLEVAERLGGLREIGRMMRSKVAETVASAPKDVLFFINLHASDLEDEQLYDVTAPLSTVAERVVLEITERVALDGIRDARRRVGTLRNMGFRIAVDDLGAGYAGLTSLAQLEPEVVKLDMSLVRDVHAHPTKQRVIQSMARLCSELGMLVISEGVEVPDERDALASLGCDLFQGYLFAKPGPNLPQLTW